MTPLEDGRVIQIEGETQVYLHIGLPKTATTSLQAGVFNRLAPLVDYIGVMQPRSIKQYEIFNDITTTLYSNETDFELRCPVLAKNIKDRIHAQQKPMLISEEMFTVDHNGLTWQQKLGRLGKIFAEFKVAIIVTVREPVQATYSLYVELYQQIHNEFPTFLSFLWHANQAKIYRFEQLDLVLRNSFHLGTVNYFAFENLIKQVNVTDIFGAYVEGCDQTIFHLPFINSKNKSKLGTFSKKMTISECLASIVEPMPNTRLVRLLEPLLRLQIPYSAVCIPFYSEHEKKILQKEVSKSNEFLRMISGIKYS